MILVDGQPAQGVPADDRGLNYGDGLFETLRLQAGRAPLLARHLDRLEAGCGRLGLPFPGRDLLADEVEGLARGAETGVLKVVLTRGSGGRGYAPPAAVRPRRILSRHPLPDWPLERYAEGLRVGLCETRLAASPALSGLKHLGRLEQVLASREVAERGLDEGLMLDPAGRLVVEATRSNLFLVIAGRLVTPEIADCGVAGVMRGLVLEVAQAAGLTISVEAVPPERLAEATELFLTGAVQGIWPVAQIEGGGTRRPGPVTRDLMRRIAEQGVAAWAG